jgi:hypothetical protein
LITTRIKLIFFVINSKKISLVTGDHWKASLILVNTAWSLPLNCFTWAGFVQSKPVGKGIFSSRFILVGSQTGRSLSGMDSGMVTRLWNFLFIYYWHCSKISWRVCVKFLSVWSNMWEWGQCLDLTAEWRKLLQLNRLRSCKY